MFAVVLSLCVSICHAQDTTGPHTDDPALRLRQLAQLIGIDALTIERLATRYRRDARTFGDGPKVVMTVYLTKLGAVTIEGEPVTSIAGQAVDGMQAICWRKDADLDGTVLIVFSRDNCGYCRKFRENEARKILDAGVPIAYRVAGGSVPRFHLTRNGRLLREFVGYKTAEFLLGEFRR